MGTEKDKLLVSGFVVDPQPQSLPDYYTRQTSLGEVLYKVAKKYVGKKGIDLSKPVEGVVVRVQNIASPTVGGFRYQLNETSNSPLDTCLRVYVYTAVDFIGFPTNLLIPSLIDQAIMDSMPYEGADAQADLEVPNVGDRVQVIHRRGISYDSPVGKYLGCISSEAVPPALGLARTIDKFLGFERKTSVPFSKGIDPNDECIKSNGMGDDCAWKRGRVLGKIELEPVPSIIKSNLRARPDVVKAYKEMRAAAKSDKIKINATSAFRTYKQQANMKRRKPKLAVNAGYSRHQTGIALDINTNRAHPPTKTTKTYNWLAQNAHKYGFVRTVKGEPWHWVYVGISEASKRRPRYT